MRNAGCRTEYDWDFKLFRQLECVFCKLISFLRCCWVKAWDFCKVRIPPRVLLILRGVAAWIIGNDKYKSALDAGIRKRHKRVGCHVEADVFHYDRRPYVTI